MARLSAAVVMLVVLLAGAARDAAAQQDGELHIDQVPLPDGASSVDAATPDATPDGGGPPPVDVIPTCEWPSGSLGECVLAG